MSALGATPPGIVVVRSLDHLAPLMREALTAAMADPAMKALDAMVFETERTHATALAYYLRGRPPTKEYPRTVTNAPDELWSWHGYWLAADIIHRTKEWNVTASWFASMADICKRYGMKWGGDWKTKDLPHVQWGKCKASPSQQARELIKSGGREAVWKAVGAM